MPDDSEISPRWEKIGGLEVLKVWELEYVFPEIALIRTPNDLRTKFSQDAKSYMEFLNKNKIFSKDVIEIGPWVTLSGPTDSDASSSWLLTLMHGKMSRVITSAIPQLRTDLAE